jgi:uncharacterized membrane protein YdjX (TVP38/TMEM64 family)
MRRAISSRHLLLLPLAVVAAITLTLHFELLTFDADRIAARIREAGALGPVVLVALLVVQSVIAPLPSQPLLMAAGFVYGTVAGFAIGWLGVALGACVCFALSRVLGRPFVERFVSPARLARFDDYVERRGLRTVFLTVLSLRLFVHISFDTVSYACGLSRFPALWFFVATGIGEVPKVLAFTYLGAGIGEAPPWARALIVAGLLGAVLAWLWIIRGRFFGTAAGESPDR